MNRERIAIICIALGMVLSFGFMAHFSAETVCASGHHVDPCPYFSANMVYCDDPMAGDPCAPADWKCIGSAWGWDGCPP